jgi:hypothetical protein
MVSHKPTAPCKICISNRSWMVSYENKYQAGERIITEHWIEIETNTQNRAISNKTGQESVIGGLILVENMMRVTRSSCMFIKVYAL